MSTKGLSVTACRHLVEKLSREGVTLLVLHDFDKSGFSILSTLQRNTRRYRFHNKPTVIDLGIRLADVREFDLEASAEDAFDRGRDFKKRQNLLQNGATAEEAEFLLRKRVELNAMTSDQLVAFIERKLQEQGVKKIVPNSDLLGETYRLVMHNQKIE